MQSESSIDGVWEQPKTNVTDKLVSLVSSGNDAGLEKYVSQASVRQFLEEHSWTAVSTILNYDYGQEFNEAQLLTINILFRHLTQIGNPKELVFAYLECCEAFKQVEIFKLAIPHLAQTMLKLPIGRSSLDIVLDTVYSHIKTLEWNPLASSGDNGYKLVEIDDHLLEATNTQSILNVISAVNCVLLDLVKPLVGQWRTSLKPFQAQLLVDICCKILHYPLLYVHLDGEYPILKTCFDHVVAILSSVCPTTSTLYKDNLVTAAFSGETLLIAPLADSRSNESSAPGLANLAFLQMCENLGQYPQVFTNEYRFKLMLPYLNSLYTHSAEPAVAHKALQLSSRLLQGLSYSCLDVEYAQTPCLRGMVLFCYWTMQYCELSVLRKNGMIILRSLVDKLTIDARGNVYMWLLKSERNADILSHTYSLVKDYIHESWSTDCEQTKRMCLSLLALIFTAPEEDKQGDIIADLNRISSAINLAIYLVLRDQKRQSPFTKRMNDYIHRYLQPVGKCLEEELQEYNRKLEEGSSDSPDVCVSVGGADMKMDEQTEREMITSIISKLELVIFNHHYITELLSA